MFKKYLILLLLAHIAADFYIQTEKMAEKKMQSIKWLFIHCAYYLGIMLFFCLPVISYKIIVGAILASVLHLLIDAIKFVCITVIERKEGMTRKIERDIFFADQFLHVVCLIGVAYWAVKVNIQMNECRVIADFFNIVGIPGFTAVTWIFVLLFIHKPANIAIQKLLAIYRPAGNIADKKEVNAGSFIGTMERIIMLIFLSIEQYSAIGLVLTAKSIARYDKISKEKDFAEYYLLGTLLSTLTVIAVSFIL